MLLQKIHETLALIYGYQKDALLLHARIISKRAAQDYFRYQLRCRNEESDLVDTEQMSKSELQARAQKCNEIISEYKDNLWYFPNSILNCPVIQIAILVDQFR